MTIIQDEVVQADVVTAVSHVKYPSIDQFRTIVKQVRYQSNYHGVPLPKLKFVGTVKAHGTNASVATNGTDTWHQSREHIITPIKDNAGFSQFATFHANYIAQVLTRTRSFLGLATDDATKVAVYGEWCGGSIQKGVALSKVEKMFVVFGISYGEEGSRTWIPAEHHAALLELEVANTFKVYSVYQFPTWEIEIDFANPEASQNALVDLTNAVEAQCPIGTFFGVEGIGEGIVWTCKDASPYYNGLRFKVKGEKHSVSKVKTLVEVDTVKVATIAAFIDRVLTVNRMQQMKDKLTEAGLDANSVKHTGDFLKLIGQDVIKEESDTLFASGLSNKEVMSKLSQVARNWFLANIV